MKVKKIDNVFVLRLEVGDEITECLIQLCKSYNITAATVQGIGAADKVTVGYYSLDERQYFTKTYEKQMEMTSLSGNISVKNSEPYLHLHATFTDENYSAVGGHLNSATVSVTAELFVTCLNGVIDRRVNLENGLNIFDI